MTRQTVPCLVCGSWEHTSSSCNRRQVARTQSAYLGITRRRPSDRACLLRPADGFGRWPGALARTACAH